MKSRALPVDENIIINIADGHIKKYATQSRMRDTSYIYYVLYYII